MPFKYSFVCSIILCSQFSTAWVVFIFIFIFFSLESSLLNSQSNIFASFHDTSPLTHTIQIVARAQQLKICQNTKELEVQGSD